jgi:hypothetical protein
MVMLLINVLLFSFLKKLLSFDFQIQLVCKLFVISGQAWSFIILNYLWWPLFKPEAYIMCLRIYHQINY